MQIPSDEIEALLARQHPYDHLPELERVAVAQAMLPMSFQNGDALYHLGSRLEGLYLIAEGQIDVRDDNGALVSILGAGNSFGERGLMRDGNARTSATAASDARVLMLPAHEFQRLRKAYPVFERFFDRSRTADARPADLATMRLADLMSPNPVTCSPEATVADAARLMRDRRVSCLLVVEDDLLRGIVTNRDLVSRVLAEGLSPDATVRAIMTEDPKGLSPDALGSDVLHAMLELGVGHLPVVQEGRPVGIVTQTDLTHQQAVSSGKLIREIVRAPDAEHIAKYVARIPEMLVQLVGAGNRHEVTTRLITDIADAATRRLLRLAEDCLGPPPVPYLWLACGSQGRQEQSGVSDQDNCLFLHDDARPEHDAYFEALARFVGNGLDTCGYFFCPGDMMATNPRWRQPIRVWREYFEGWIAKPDPTAQMLASVMFDLRPIGGDQDLYGDLVRDTLDAAAKNSIFVAHMVANSLKHAPPLGLFRNVATIRSGEHKDTIDVKLNGVVPVVDLGRIYALQGRLPVVNTRARLTAAASAGVISDSGAKDLIDAYDLIAETRLIHQADLVRRGEKPDNFMPPATLSDFERSHLRDAFVVVKTMQSALGHGRASVL